MGPAQVSTHMSAHTSMHANTKARINQDEKTWKATGSYLTNLKVNDFSISLYPRLIPVTGIASAAMCMHVLLPVLSIRFSSSVCKRLLDGYFCVLSNCSLIFLHAFSVLCPASER